MRTFLAFVMTVLYVGVVLLLLGHQQLGSALVSLALGAGAVTVLLALWHGAWEEIRHVWWLWTRRRDG